jgi:membrane fusion protein, multidrug efflux system
MAGQGTPRKGCLRNHGDMARITTLVLVAAALCTTPLSLGCTKKDENAKDDKISNVKVMVVEKRTIQPYIDAIGSLSPYEEVTISSEVDGILDSINVDEGTQVSKGMVLARVNDTDYRLNVSNARATLKQAEATLVNLKIEQKRKEALFKEELVTLQQFDDVSTRLTVAAQELDRAGVAMSLAQERLWKATIRSPIKGIVKQKVVTAGDFIRASMPVLSIVQVDPLKLDFTITEKNVSSLKLGQDVIFTVDAFPGKEFSGKLSIIYPSLEERTRTLKVEATVPNHSLDLKPGFFARLRIYTSAPREAVVIPVTSILYESTRVRVFVREGKKARERFLKVGGKYGDVVEVLDGLKGGENLIIVGQNNLTDGTGITTIR